MYYKKRRKPYSRKKEKKCKITFISLDDPKVKKLVEKKIYEEYLRRLHSNGGDDNG